METRASETVRRRSRRLFAAPPPAVVALATVVALTAVCALTVACAAAAKPPVAVDGGIAFSHDAPAAGEVFLAGDFNGWDAGATALDRDADGTWRTVIPLPPGTFEYKFVVDGQWYADPANPQRRADPFGGENSVVVVGDDGDVVTSPTGRPPTPGSPDDGGDDIQVSRAPVGATAGGGPRTVEDGVLFTHHAPGAAQVHLAGSFNEWSATALPLVNDGRGNWSVVLDLEPGAHTYKFVVDGNWVTDPDNPTSAPDGYGGTNSLVQVDGQGAVTEAVAGAAPATRSGLKALDSQVQAAGRYLTRFTFEKNILDDPRWRLQRPKQSVDLNFLVDVSPIVATYMRMRFDNDENIILNNVAGFLDEAQLEVRPDDFHLQAYWNMEIFTLDDPLNLLGDIDHPGTILDDHFDAGKGTAGVVIRAAPFGLDFTGYFADVYEADIYNDPDLYDKTGNDRFALRLSKQLGPLRIGVPAAIERGLWWLNFEDVVGQSSTGMPAFDDYLARTGDSSTWFEYEDRTLLAGVDLGLVWGESGRNRLAVEKLFGERRQRFATGNESAQNNTSGAIDVPVLERDLDLWFAQFHVDLHPPLRLRAEHTWSDSDGAGPDERELQIGFLPQAVANKQLTFAIAPATPETRLHYTDVTLDYARGENRLVFWVEHIDERRDYAPAGRTVPRDSTQAVQELETWIVSGLVGVGATGDPFGHAELEYKLRWSDLGVFTDRIRTEELILRWERDLTANVAAIADVRYLHYWDYLDEADGSFVETQRDFWAPFVGLRYRPEPNIEVVAAYGVDPLNFSIDYEGRHTGRWWFRQLYAFDHPEAGELEAEQALADARVITLRAQYRF
ncbi:MAG: glycogen-binding domain-containing protein [Candidatus Krumholzibacteriia bacterium]